MIPIPSVSGIDARLLATLVALGDYLQDVVVVGGWVPHIYRKIWPSESPVVPRRTFDLDVAARKPVTAPGPPHVGRRPMPRLRPASRLWGAGATTQRADASRS
jgi:hypothetical protein